MDWRLEKPCRCRTRCTPGLMMEFSKQQQEPVRLSVPPTSLIQSVPFPCSRFRAAEQVPGRQQFWLTVWQLRTNLLLLMVQGEMLQGAVAAWGPLHSAEPATAAVGQVGRTALPCGARCTRDPVVLMILENEDVKRKKVTKSKRWTPLLV